MATLFEKRRDALVRDGFTLAEARWAAERKVRLGDRTVQVVRRARRNFVRDHMRVFGSTRRRAIREAHRVLSDRNRRQGLVGSEINNIFREIS